MHDRIQCSFTVCSLALRMIESQIVVVLVLLAALQTQMFLLLREINVQDGSGANGGGVRTEEVGEILRDVEVVDWPGITI